uniref:Uncharacterized protein n=1 Tax=Arundo donax TaxID=35708 RepID=A0A0A9FF56_ARUDO
MVTNLFREETDSMFRVISFIGFYTECNSYDLTESQDKF